MNPGSITGQGAVGATAAWQASVSQADKSQGAWVAFKRFFTRPTVSTATLINTVETFKQSFKEQTDALARSLPASVSPEHREGFTRLAAEMMQQIALDAMHGAEQDAVERGDGSLSEGKLQQTVRTANAKAQEALRSLKLLQVDHRLAAGQHGDVRPQVLPRYEGGRMDGYTLVRRAPQIENLVLRGGGAKGVGNPPALVEMERAGLLSGLELVVGTSAGALTAAVLASGMSATELKTFTDGLDMGSLKGKPEHYATKYPTVGVSLTGFHAGKALETIDRQTAGSVAGYLNAEWAKPAFQQRLTQLRTEGKLSEADCRRLDALRTQNYDTDRTAQMITFHDLEILHRIEPGKFKQLTLTGWDSTHGTETYFRAASHPNMPVAVAARISMSIPVFFASVQYAPPGERHRSWADGGIGSNMPTEAVYVQRRGVDVEETAARTMLMTFDEGGRAYTVLHGPKDQREKKADFLESVLSGNPLLTQTQNADRKKIHDAGPNAFVVFHGDIGTLDMGASQERVAAAQAMSQLKTLEMIEQRMDQAYAVQTDSLEEAVVMMSPSDKQAILDGGAPNPVSYPRGADDEQYRIDARIWGLLQAEVDEGG